MPETNDQRVAVLATHVGNPLVIRSNPSEEEVRGFVEEHNRRYHAGEAGGPSGVAAFKIVGAKFYTSELDFINDPDEDDGEIDISDLDPFNNL